MIDQDISDINLFIMTNSLSQSPSLTSDQLISLLKLVSYNARHEISVNGQRINFHGREVSPTFMISNISIEV